MTEVDLQETGLSRREALRIGLATASLFVVSGCQVFGSTSELESARNELMQSLEALGRDDVQEVGLLSIARQIASNTRVLVDEHDAFLSDFDRLTRNRDVSESDLQRLADLFSTRRVELRNGLFRLQDELRAEMTADEWTVVVKALNRKADAARTNLLES